jgi:hypothetical protein
MSAFGSVFASFAGPFANFAVKDFDLRWQDKILNRKVRKGTRKGRTRRGFQASSRVNRGPSYVRGLELRGQTNENTRAESMPRADFSLVLSL